MPRAGSGLSQGADYSDVPGEWLSFSPRHHRQPIKTFAVCPGETLRFLGHRYCRRRNYYYRCSKCAVGMGRCTFCAMKEGRAHQKIIDAEELKKSCAARAKDRDFDPLSVFQDSPVYHEEKVCSLTSCF